MTIQSLRQKHTDRTRQSIIDAAFKLFLDHGFAATTVDDIAMRADIAPRTFFRYFPTKESVLFHDSDAKLNSIRERLSERPAGESAAEAIVGLLAGMAEDLSNDQKRCELIVRLSAEDDSFLAARHRAMMDQATTAIVTAVSERTGVPASDVGLQAMTAAVVACASTAIHCWFNEGAPGDPRAYLERAVASCREAFSASQPLRAP